MALGERQWRAKSSAGRQGRAAASGERLGRAGARTSLCGGPNSELDTRFWTATADCQAHRVGPGVSARAGSAPRKAEAQPAERRATGDRLAESNAARGMGERHIYIEQRRVVGAARHVEECQQAILVQVSQVGDLCRGRGGGAERAARAWREGMHPWTAAARASKASKHTRGVKPPSTILKAAAVSTMLSVMPVLRWRER